MNQSTIDRCQFKLFLLSRVCLSSQQRHIRSWNPRVVAKGRGKSWMVCRPSQTHTERFLTPVLRDKMMDFTVSITFCLMQFSPLAYRCLPIPTCPRTDASVFLCVRFPVQGWLGLGLGTGTYKYRNTWAYTLFDHNFD